MAVLCDLRWSLNLSEPAGELVWGQCSLNCQSQAVLARPALALGPAPGAALLARATAPETSGLARGGPRESAADLHQRPPTWGQSDRLRVCPPSPGGCRQVWACPLGLCQADRGQAKDPEAGSGETPSWPGWGGGQGGLWFPCPSLPREDRGPGCAWPGSRMAGPLRGGSWVWTLSGEETLGTEASLSGHPRPWASPVTGGPPCSDPTPVTTSQPWPRVASWGPNCFCVQATGEGPVSEVDGWLTSYSHGAQPTSDPGLGSGLWACPAHALPKRG